MLCKVNNGYIGTEYKSKIKNYRMPSGLYWVSWGKDQMKERGMVKKIFQSFSLDWEP